MAGLACDVRPSRRPAFRLAGVCVAPRKTSAQNDASLRTYVRLDRRRTRRRPCCRWPILSLVGPTLPCPRAANRTPGEEEGCAAQIVAGDEQDHASGYHHQRRCKVNWPQARRTFIDAWGYAQTTGNLVESSQNRHSATVPQRSELHGTWKFLEHSGGMPVNEPIAAAGCAVEHRV